MTADPWVAEYTARLGWPRLILDTLLAPLGAQPARVLPLHAH
jgi:hypothetical protein